MATGGDFARTFRSETRIDVGRAGGRYFVNAASVGLERKPRAAFIAGGPRCRGASATWERLPGN